MKIGAIQNNNYSNKKSPNFKGFIKFPDDNFIDAKVIGKIKDIIDPFKYEPGAPKGGRELKIYSKNTDKLLTKLLYEPDDEKKLGKEVVNSIIKKIIDAVAWAKEYNGVQIVDLSEFKKGDTEVKLINNSLADKLRDAVIKGNRS